MSIELDPGAMVRVVAPVLPPVHVAPPDPTAVIVVPVPGPQGPPGVGGDPEAIQELIDDSIAVHVAAFEPHTAYDIDMPSMSLIFQNGLV